MRKTPAILVAALVAASAMGGPTLADTLSDLRWEKRIVILFGADEGRLQQQASEFQRDEAGMADRDMLVFAVDGDGLREIHGSIPADETAEALRERFGVGSTDAFTAILIGKDGGEKWRGHEVVPHAEIDAIIDAMPMRRAGD